MYKGTKVLIPKSLRPEMLKRIVVTHQGIEACTRKARARRYWPRMTTDIKEVVGTCSTCQEYQIAKLKQPMKSQPVPRQCRQIVSSDLFLLNGKTYFVIVDHFSDYFEVDELRKDAKSKTVIGACKVHFAPTVHQMYSSVLLMDRRSCLKISRHSAWNGPSHMSHHHCYTAKVMARLSQQ